MNISPEAFDEQVEQAIADLPPEFRRHLDTIPVIVEDVPAPQVLGRLRHRRTAFLLGLFQGVPLTRQSVDTPNGPHQITLYRRNLMAVCGESRELTQQIRRTLIHELGHYLGFSERQLRQAGY